MSVALIVSTYNQPEHLDRCLFALGRQTYRDFEIVMADDGSGDETRRLIGKYQEALAMPVRHVWQEDRGFRKTRILNKAILATGAEYLVFMDGDCVAHPDFVREHVARARSGSYLNGSLIRLNAALTQQITHESICTGAAFDGAWFTRKGRTFSHRYLRCSLAYPVRRWLDRHSSTELYWLGSNSSCYRSDAVAVNGFDQRFTYGFEDSDFGFRLENFGLRARTVRWTAVLLHLEHGKPWSIPEEMERNLALRAVKEPGGVFRAREGLEELRAEQDARRGW
jgi:GT2 family glycosyltransferase